MKREVRTKVQFATNLTTVLFMPLSTVVQIDSGETRKVTDTNAVGTARLYRVNISLP